MNILSLDIDYISEAYITGDLATGYLGRHPISEQYWNIAAGNPMLLNPAHLVENRDGVRFIFKTFIKSITNKSKVVFGIHHDSILNHIPKEPSTPLHIVNVDHHHDLGYDQLQHQQAITYGVCNEANWVPILSKYIEEYTWVGNPNSYKPQMDNQSFKYTEICSTEERNSLDIDKKEWDLIYICLSPNYLHDKHWVYFYLLIDLYESLSGSVVEIDECRYSSHF